MAEFRYRVLSNDAGTYHEKLWTGIFFDNNAIPHQIGNTCTHHALTAAVMGKYAIHYRKNNMEPPFKKLSVQYLVDRTEPGVYACRPTTCRKRRAINVVDVEGLLSKDDYAQGGERGLHNWKPLSVLEQNPQLCHYKAGLFKISSPHKPESFERMEEKLAKGPLFASFFLRKDDYKKVGGQTLTPHGAILRLEEEEEKKENSEFASHSVVLYGIGYFRHRLTNVLDRYYLYGNSYGSRWGIHGSHRIKCSDLASIYEIKLPIRGLPGNPYRPDFSNFIPIPVPPPFDLPPSSGAMPSSSSGAMPSSSSGAMPSSSQGDRKRRWEGPSDEKLPRERVTEQGFDKSWYGACNSSTETVSSQRNGFDSKHGLASADAKLQPMHIIANQSSIGLSKSWKNSEKEYFWEDPRLSGVSEKLVSVKKDLENHNQNAQATHDITSRVNRETSSDLLPTFSYNQSQAPQVSVQALPQDANSSNSQRLQLQNLLQSDTVQTSLKPLSDKSSLADVMSSGIFYSVSGNIPELNFKSEVSTQPPQFSASLPTQSTSSGAKEIITRSFCTYAT